ncbi:MAG: hemerythrin family protein [Ekhidna sp.]|nr:hemerythrin family protein [Ekhidna sp.]
MNNNFAQKQEQGDTMITWSEKFEIGIEEIDEQHQSLFNYINDLEECIQDGEYEGNRIQIIFNFFQLFCATHFSLEETCMIKDVCPVYEQNKKAHANFLAYYKKFRVTYKTAINKLALLEEFHGILIKWLANHIMKIDMQMKKKVA